MFFNFNMNNLYDGKNSKKIFILGIILFSVGLNCLVTKRHFAISVFSWGLAIAFLYCTWLSGKELIELKRYAEKKLINQYRLMTYLLFIISVLLIVFPVYFNMILSVCLGVYLLLTEIRYFILNRNNYYYTSIWKVLKIFIGVILIVSPLFFINFIVKIFSCISMIFGIYFVNVSLTRHDGY